MMEPISNMMEKITQQAIDEITEILTGIQSGKLAHIQTNTHCGSAHCVAGWKVAMDASRKIWNDPYKAVGIDIDFIHETQSPAYLLWEEVRRLELSVKDDAFGPNAVDYATVKWGLNAAESTLLFGPSQQLRGMFRLLTAFRRGYRVIGWDDNQLATILGDSEGVITRLLKDIPAEGYDDDEYQETRDKQRAEYL
jgi:hypothetical protein